MSQLERKQTPDIINININGLSPSNSLHTPITPDTNNQKNSESTDNTGKVVTP